MAETFLTLMADWDDAAQAHFTGFREALQQAGFTGTQTADLPHHISLATFDLAEEARAIALTRRLAETFAPVAVQVNHVGIFPGGRVLFAAPDITPRLAALQAACGVERVGGYLWTPHTTLLMDEPEAVAQAVGPLMAAFHPVQGRVTRLHLCAFWPTREVLSLPLTGEA